MWKPEGVIVPMFTPCLPDGMLDPTGIQEFVRYLEDRKGVSAIFPRCGVGKMYSFSFEEVKTMLGAAIPAAKRCAIIPGTIGQYSGKPEEKPDPDLYLSQTIELSLMAQSLGAPAVVIIMPSGLRTDASVSTEDQIFNFLKAVDSKLDISIMLYQPPGMDAAFRMTSPLMKRLSGLEHVVGMKLSSGDEPVWKDLGATAEETGFTMICGVETDFLMALMHGAHGVIGEGCDLYPEVLYGIKHYFDDGDLDTAEVAQEQVKALLGMKQSHSSEIIAKALARRKGYKVHVTRRISPVPTGYAAEEQEAPPPEEFMDWYETRLDKACEPYLKLIE